MAMHSDRSASVAATANLLKNLMGSGIFSLPSALLAGSALPGLVTIALVGALCSSSFVLIAFLCQQLRVKTYREIGLVAFGQHTATFIDVSIFASGFFCCVSYVILVVDFLHKALDGLAIWRGAPRLLLIWVCTLAFMLPLSHVRDLSPLRYTSMLGLSVIVLVWLYVLLDCLWNWQRASLNLRENCFRFDIGVFTTVAISTNAFKAHYNSPKFFAELGGDLTAYVKVAALAYTAAFLIYASFALAGLGLFGSEVFGNVLKNYPSEGNTAILMAWLGMAFAIIFTYPLVFSAARDSLVRMSPALQSNARQKPAVTHVIVTSGLVCSISAVACCVEDVSLVSGLLGATVGSTLCWILPASAYLQVARNSTGPALRFGTVPLLHGGKKLPKVSQIQASSSLVCYSIFIVMVGMSSMIVGIGKTLGVL